MENLEMKKLKERRGEMITNFAFLETLIKDYIADYYQPQKQEEFIEDVLENEYFNFGLLVKIFFLVLDRDPNKGGFPSGKLRRLPQIRNIIAHGAVHASYDPAAKKIGKRYFRNGGKNHLCEDVFKEYGELRDVLQPALEDLLQRKGVNLGTLADNEYE